MKKRLFLPLILCMLPLPGCEMIVPPWQLSALHTQAKQPVTCTGREDCEAKWKRVTDWAKSNARFPISTQTATVIKTDEPRALMPQPIFTIRMVRTTDNTASIIMDISCNDWFGCMPPLLKWHADFANYVMNPSVKLKRLDE